MYVRWKRKQRKDIVRSERYESESVPYPLYRQVREPAWLRAAVLVESRRVNGLPRQRTVAYLGSIRECYLTPDHPHGVLHRTYFWRAVEAKLGSLDLPAGERARIVATLETTVPHASEEAVAQANRELEARFAAVSRMVGTRPV